MGYIDLKGEFVIPPRFVQALWFSEGLAVVRIDQGGTDPLLMKQAVIDREGRIVMP
jgi:hypothetical protein